MPKVSKVQREAKEEKKKIKRRQLALAMDDAKVASASSCINLVKGGKVQVNGEVVKDPEFLIQKDSDVISVMGRSFKLGAGEIEVIPDAGAADEEQSWARGRSDFGGGRMDEIREEQGRTFSSRIDGGFLKKKMAFKNMKG